MAQDTTDAVFAVPPVPEARRSSAAEAGWPPDLIDRINALRWPGWKQDLYVGFRGHPPMEAILAEVADRERLADGLQVREATWEDDERISELFANSAERIGGWLVTVERSPNPYAQLRLQENGHMKLVVDRGVAVAVSAYSGRSSIVAGQRLSVGWMGGWRVHDALRRLGYANYLMSTPGSATNVAGMISYWYVRMENENAQGFIAHSVERINDGGDAQRPVGKLTAEVIHLDAKGVSSAAPPDPQNIRVRMIDPADIDRCVALINRTHDGLDLFRPHTAAFLEHRLDDLFWGPKPPFVPSVYGWADMFVLEHDGEIVACAGLWDRGRDVRDRWRHRETGEERLVDSAYVMDLGFAAGHERDMAALIGHLHARTRDLGRTTLAVALEHLPDVTAHLEWASPQIERRLLESMGFNDGTITITERITHPYTDLAYW